MTDNNGYADTFKALEVATAGLEADELGRYLALACFAEDTIVPPATIGRLWGLAHPETSAQLRRFADLRLVRLEAGVWRFTICNAIICCCMQRRRRWRMSSCWPPTSRGVLQRMVGGGASSILTTRTCGSI